MRNFGSTFGVFPGLPVWVFAIVLAYLLIVAVKMRELWGRIGLFLIIIGGAGNFTSRVLFGAVVDNWNFFGLFYNNIWDYLIVVGVGVYVIHLFRLKI